MPAYDPYYKGSLIEFSDLQTANRPQPSVTFFGKGTKKCMLCLFGGFLFFSCLDVVNDNGGLSLRLHLLNTGTPSQSAALLISGQGSTCNSIGRQCVAVVPVKAFNSVIGIGANRAVEEAIVNPDSRNGIDLPNPCNVCRREVADSTASIKENDTVQHNAIGTVSLGGGTAMEPQTASNHGLNLLTGLHHDDNAPSAKGAYNTCQSLNTEESVKVIGLLNVVNIRVSSIAVLANGSGSTLPHLPAGRSGPLISSAATAATGLRLESLALCVGHIVV